MSNAKRRGMRADRAAALAFFVRHDEAFQCHWCAQTCSGAELGADRLGAHYGDFAEVVAACACCNALRGSWGVAPVRAVLAGGVTPVALREAWASAPPSVPAGSFSLRGCAHRARHRHRQRGLDGQVLSADELMRLWDADAWPYADETPLRPSPDRIDVSRGYVKGNVRWLPWLLNAAMRGGYTLSEVLARARAMVEDHDAVLAA